MTGLPETETLVIIALALGLGGFTKGLTGVGMPLVAIPIMAGFWEVERAVAVLVIPGIVTNSWLMWKLRGEWREVPWLWIILGAGLVGAVIGSWVLAWLDNRSLALLLAFCAGAYLINLYFNPEFKIAEKPARRMSSVIGVVGGVVQGATGVSAPVFATYLHALRLTQKGYVFAIVTIFQVLALAQLGALWQFGVFTAERAMEGTFALIPALIALPIGMHIGSKLDRKMFDRVIIGLLIIMEFRLLYIGFYG